ncbi:hypothetical protein G7059_05820 [Erysipelothrix sp. HDW6A]|uniref:hypothetical protein n=1 Tax=Erysipelothrix sp. HDW6A TaxID=2714928 RepID=UPI00140BE8B7|nr:hypothetical protein [Erysipelothrix sp. HDW6A]QIK57388.1 hypothetical protein G7059_05820 [Erysipelothrix sp. HDW6A]
MTNNKKISLGITTLIGVGAAIATVVVVKKIMNSEAITNRRREREAEAFLREKYGDDVLVGKRIVLVDENDTITKTDIAKDIVKYEMQ